MARVSIVLNSGTVVTAANTPVTPTTIYIGNTNNGASGIINGHIRVLAAFSTLADANLDTLSAVGAPLTIAASGGTVNGVGSASGADTTVAVGASLFNGVGASAGSSTVTATGASLA